MRPDVASVTIFYARGAAGLVGRGMAAEPGVEGFAAAIGGAAVIVLGERARRCDRAHRSQDGVTRASFFNARRSLNELSTPVFYSWLQRAYLKASQNHRKSVN